MSGEGEKQATVLELATNLSAGLIDLQARLENKFSRVEVKSKQEHPPVPSRGNVLDEIIDSLEDSRVRLSGTLVFLSSEILPKIS